MRVALASISLALVGCGANSFAVPEAPPLDLPRYYLDPKGTLTPDPNFTADELAAIRRGVEAWTPATDGCVALRFGPKGLPVRRVDRDPETYGSARYRSLHIRIVLDPNRTDDAAARTAAHEVGHMLGLPHFAGDYCIMHSPNTGRLEFCAEEVAAVKLLWGCE